MTSPSQDMTTSNPPRVCAIADADRAIPTTISAANVIPMRPDATNASWPGFPSACRVSRFTKYRSRLPGVVAYGYAPICRA